MRDPKRAAFNAAVAASAWITRLTLESNLLRAERNQARHQRDTLRGEVAAQAIQISELRRQRQEVADNVANGE